MAIELIVLDVEGTLTNGKIVFDNNGDELKCLNVKDGLAIKTWTKSFGKNMAIISGRESSSVKRRAEELGIQYIFQGETDKLNVIKGLCKELGIEMSQVAAIGDDLNDYNLLDSLENSFCPNDATKEITKVSRTILRKSGGDGAVREMIEHICIFDDLREEFLNHYKG